jgi:hypothetical protein
MLGVAHPKIALDAMSDLFVSMGFHPFYYMKPETKEFLGDCTDLKECSYCHNWKSYFEFSMDENNWDYLNKYCKYCVTNYSKFFPTDLKSYTKARKARLKTQKRIKTIKQATPLWYEAEKVNLIYQKAKEWGFHVDHVIPLQGKNVCGLHCWANLQLLDKHLNSKKRNKHHLTD